MEHSQQFEPLSQGGTRASVGDTLQHPTPAQEAAGQRCCQGILPPVKLCCLPGTSPSTGTAQEQTFCLWGQRDTQTRLLYTGGGSREQLIFHA